MKEVLEKRRQHPGPAVVQEVCAATRSS